VVSSLWDRNDEKEGKNGTEGVPCLSIVSIPQHCRYLGSSSAQGIPSSDSWFLDTFVAPNGPNDNIQKHGGKPMLH